MSRIAVIGGGIGGLAAAVALQQFDFEVQVYEQTGPDARFGAGTWIPPNAMRVLEHLELAEQIRETGVEIRRAEVERSDGRAVGSVDFSAIERQTGFGNYSIRRSTLRDILQGSLDSETVEFGAECRHVEDRGDEIYIAFEDGVETRADVLVGADGIESYVRGDIFGMVRLRYGGQVWYRGFADVQLPDVESGRAREFWGGARRFGYAGVDGNRVAWYAAVAEPDPAKFDWDRSTLDSRFEEFPTPVVRALEETDSEEIERVEPRDVRPLETWSSGRVVLIGDAAHAPLPNLGQGAAQAIEDGWALAACLDRWDDHREAFRRFEKHRIPRANRVIRQSRFLGRIAHLDSTVAAGARDLLFGVVPGAFERLEAEWLYDVDALIGLAE